MRLTDPQKEAIKHEGGNLQLIACAGSGKTEVVARHIAHLLSPSTTNQLVPANVVAFTFTDKAAAELKERIVTRVHETLGDVPGLAEMFVGTIHAYCLELLQTHLFEFLKCTVLTEVQTKLFISRNSKKSGLSGVEIIAGPSIGQTLKRGPQNVKVFLEALNVIREDDVDFAAIPDGLKAAYESYDDLLDEHRYLDYSKIMVEAIAALYDEADPNRRRLQDTLRDRIKYVIVDEYQDVNPLQESLIRRFHELGAHTCVVGDDDQTIYQWRGSEIRNILEFAKRYPNVDNVTIAENFRSSGGVVETARAIAEINTSRLPKKMSAGGHQEFVRGDLLVLSFKTPEEEAAWIAGRIIDLQGVPFIDHPGAGPRGLSWADCAVLLRSVRANGEPITAAFKTAGIPYVIGGLSNLFDSAEVQAAVALFNYIVGDIGAAQVREAWQAADVGLSDADLDAGIEVLDRAKAWTPGARWGAYNIQRAYLDFLEAVAIREERVPPTSAGAARGDIVYCNLGKFSQAISDFEQIHFQSEPGQKYKTFVWWLENEAPDYYEEGGEETGFAQPDAVQVMTIHKAKGMEWPAVFIPALQRNRFPSTAGGKGRSKWHILPRAAVPDAPRYDTSIEDERRLFYVALTRSKKFLCCTFAPTPGNQLYRQPSDFMGEFIRSPHVLTRAMPVPSVGKLEPKPRRETPNVVLSFSELKYFFECPYEFKLRFLYGFNAPLHEALGLGKSIHDALAEVHKRAQAGEILQTSDAEALVDAHFHAPFAYPVLKNTLREAAIGAVTRYLHEQGPTLNQTIHSEQQVELQVTPGITVNGRIDLIKRLDTGEVAIVDFKSSERVQAEDVTRAQLHTYAMGYRQLTGRNADLVEVLNLDQGGKSVRETVDDAMLKGTEAEIRKAGDAIRGNRMERHTNWCGTCAVCDMVGICRTNEAREAKAAAATTKRS